MKKIFYTLAVVFFLFISVACVCLFTEVGRNFLITSAMKYFFDNRVTMSVSGSSTDMRSVELITLKTSDGIDVKLKDVRINRAGFFDVPYFKIKSINVVWQNSDSNNVAQEGKNKSLNVTNQSNMQLEQSKIVTIMKIVPLFTSGFEIENFNSNIDGKKYDLNHIQYSSKNQSISLHSNEYGYLTAQLKISALMDMSVSVSFKECFDANGILNIEHILAKEKQYSIDVTHKFGKARVSGLFENPKEKIIINQCDISKTSDSIQLSGTVYPNDKKLDVRVPVLLSKLNTVTSSLNKLPKIISTAIAGKIDCAVANISTKLEDGYPTKLVLDKNGKTVAKANGYYKSNATDVTIDLFDFNIVGYKLSKVQGTILSNKISAKIIGDIFSFDAELLKKGDIFTVSKFDVLSKGGSIKLKLPTVNPIDFLKKKISQFF